MEFFAGLLAAGLAIFLNRKIVGIFHAKGIIFFVPVVEETAKTLLAVWFGASIFFTHLTFGILEAFYDLLAGTKQVGFLTAGSSLAGHLAFAGVTVNIFHWTGSLFLGIFAASMLHIGWNILMMVGLPKFICLRRKKKEEQTP